MTKEAEQISQLLIEAWLLQELSLTDMEKKIDELVVIDEEVSGV